MSWVIAVLLALILVALVSSNQGAADGIKTVMKYTGVASLFVLSWAVLFGYVLWFNEFTDAGTSSRWVSLLITLLGYPTLLWINRKKIQQAFSKDRKGAIKSSVKIVSIVGAWMLLAVLAHDIRQSGLAWHALALLIGLFGLILTLRSFSDPKNARVIWFGPPSPDRIWNLIEAEKHRFEKAEDERWGKDRINWESMSEQAQDEVNLAHWERVKDFDQTIAEKEARLIAQYHTWNKRIFLEPMLYFWLAVIMAVFTLVGDGWVVTHEFLMGTSLVNGQSWVATSLMIAGLIGLLWAIAKAQTIFRNDG